MRFFVSTGASMMMDFLLFLLMSGLISDTEGFSPEQRSGKILEFVRVPPVEITNYKDYKEHEEPKPIERRPPKIDLQNESQPPERPTNIEFLAIDIPIGTGGANFLGPWSSGGARTDGDATSVMGVIPRYPHDALKNGIEGWVELEFTVTETGTVADAIVIAAQPKRIFDGAALQAIYRWKFKPRIVDGVAIGQRARQRIEFVIEPAD